MVQRKLIYFFMFFKSILTSELMQDFLKVGTFNIQGLLTFQFLKLSQKENKIEQIWTQGGRGAPPYIHHC